MLFKRSDPSVIIIITLKVKGLKRKEIKRKIYLYLKSLIPINSLDKNKYFILI